MSVRGCCWQTEAMGVFARSLRFVTGLAQKKCACGACGALCKYHPERFVKRNETKLSISFLISYNKCASCARSLLSVEQLWFCKQLIPFCWEWLLNVVTKTLLLHFTVFYVNTTSEYIRSPYILEFFTLICCWHIAEEVICVCSQIGRSGLCFVLASAQPKKEGFLSVFTPVWPCEERLINTVLVLIKKYCR